MRLTADIRPVQGRHLFKQIFIGRGGGLPFGGGCGQQTEKHPSNRGAAAGGINAGGE